MFLDKNVVRPSTKFDRGTRNVLVVNPFHGAERRDADSIEVGYLTVPKINRKEHQRSDIRSFYSAENCTKVPRVTALFLGTNKTDSSYKLDVISSLCASMLTFCNTVISVINNNLTIHQ